MAPPSPTDEPRLMDEQEAADWRVALEKVPHLEVATAPWLDEPLPERRYIIVRRRDQ